jgi:hypothetical protein
MKGFYPMDPRNVSPYEHRLYGQRFVYGLFNSCQRFKEMQSIAPARPFYVHLCVTVSVSAAVLLFNLLHWLFRGDSLEIVLGLFCGVAFVVVTVSALLSFFLRLKSWRLSGIPLLICVGTTLILGFAPLGNLGDKLNFFVNRATRNALVAQVEAGTLRTPSNPRSIVLSLGKDVPPVSEGGNEIIVEEHQGKKYVFFFTYRGLLGYYAGFLYVPTGGSPTRYSDLARDTTTRIERLDTHWFYVAH